jgi:large subunit ribosomal protein L35
MPKLKTKKAMQKRYRITKTGKVMSNRTKRRHMMTDRTPKSKRQSRGKLKVEKMHVNAIKLCMPYHR